MKVMNCNDTPAMIAVIVACGAFIMGLVVFVINAFHGERLNKKGEPR